MNLEILPEEEKKKIIRELESIIANSEIKPYNELRTPELIADFNLSFIMLDLEREASLRRAFEDPASPREIDISPTIMKLEELKERVIRARLDQVILLENEGKGIFKTYVDSIGGSAEISIYDRSVLQYLESIMDRPFYICDEVNAASEMAVSVKDKKIIGLSMRPSYSGTHFCLSFFPKIILNWVYLKSLNLTRNNIPNLPKEINLFSNLQRLNLRSNYLKSLPSTLYKMVSLEELDLSFNQLESISSSIKDLKKLKILSLQGNNLTIVPEELFSLKSLRILNLQNNNLTIVPEELFSLKSLIELRLINNEIKEISPAIKDLKNLEAFSFGNYNTKSLPESLGNIKTLKTLKLVINDSSQLPESIGELNSLEDLDLKVKNFSSFPSSFENLSKLDTLSISSEKGKTLPRELIKLKSLSIVYLLGDIAENLMSGYTPDKQSQEVKDILNKRNVQLWIP